MEFVELNGDSLDFVVEPNTIYFCPHVVNSHGIAGSGFVVALREKFPKAILDYENWYDGNHTLDTFPKCLDKHNSLFELGNIQVVKVQEATYIVNMLAQKGFGGYGLPPGRYEAINECLRKLQVCCDKVHALGKNIVIQSPKFGSARSGLDWTKIFNMVQSIFKDTAGIWNTYTYEGPHA